MVTAPHDEDNGERISITRSVAGSTNHTQHAHRNEDKLLYTTNRLVYSSRPQSIQPNKLQGRLDTNKPSQSRSQSLPSLIDAFGTRLSPQKSTSSRVSASRITSLVCLSFCTAVFSLFSCLPRAWYFPKPTWRNSFFPSPIHQINVFSFQFLLSFFSLEQRLQ